MTFHAVLPGEDQRDLFAGLTSPPFLRGPHRPLCADEGSPEDWFVNVKQEDANHLEAVKVCMRCPLIAGCQAWALENEWHGIWGGLTERKRNRIRKRQLATAGGDSND